MRFLIDNQLPESLARWLRDRGEDAVHVLERGYAQTDDRDLWNEAVQEGRIMVSKDQDFVILASRPGETGRLLWLRIGNCRTPDLLVRMEAIWIEVEEAFRSEQRIVEVR